MAIWQFDLELIPRQVADSDPIKTIKDEFGSFRDDTGWWTDRQPPGDLKERLGFILPKSDKAWSDEMGLWGEEDSNRIDVYYTSDRVESILIRLDLRNSDFAHLVDKILDLAKYLDCKLCLMEQDIALEPDRALLLDAIKHCNAFRYVTDPEGFFRSLA